MAKNIILKDHKKNKSDFVVINPPYSKKYDPEGLKQDARFFGFAMAPKSKADYAFLLDGLAAIKKGNAMSCLLPHGVLFRGVAMSKKGGRDEQDFSKPL